MTAVRQLARHGVLHPLDLHFAEALAQLVPGSDSAVLLGAALASRSTREGHVCADLELFARRPLLDSEGQPIDVPLPPVGHWRSLLEKSALVGDGTDATPLVLDDRGRLYLRRYWQHERRLAELLLGRVGLTCEPVEVRAARDSLARLFGPRQVASTASRLPVDWQRIAAEVALITRFLVISGGPGTGKTSTVVKLVAMLVEQSLALGRPKPRILLVAPTGKAAARLVESIRSAKGRLACSEEVRAAIVEEASTIHRALGSVPGSRTRMRYNSENALPADVVIVDEASMVDVALMRRLLEAVPRGARLILLGDRDQLASVEAGTVLGDICGTDRPPYSAELRRRVSEVFGEELPDSHRVGPGGISDHVVELSYSHRFGMKSGIGNLARAVQRGDLEAALTLLHAPSVEDVLLIPRAPERGIGGALRKAVVAGYRPYLRSKDAAEALGELERYRVLAAHRRGPSGVESLNAEIEQALSSAGLIVHRRRWYSGRPVLVTQNDYQLRLFNGDIGVVFRPKGARVERAYFADAGGFTRELMPARLPPHETAYAMSVHKSQGSELDEVAVVLPDPRSPLLTRELLYTAITRARRRVTIYGSETALRAALARRVERSSGLGDLLWHRKQA